MSQHAAARHARPRLFVWNSWARAARPLLRAGFGGAAAGPETVEWLNTLLVDDPYEVCDAREHDRSIHLIRHVDTNSTLLEIDAMQSDGPSRRARAHDGELAFSRARRRTRKPYRDSRSRAHGATTWCFSKVNNTEAHSLVLHSRCLCIIQGLPSMSFALFQ